MAKLTGLHLRAGVYQLRILIPQDLQASYEGKTCPSSNGLRQMG